MAFLDRGAAELKCLAEPQLTWTVSLKDVSEPRLGTASVSSMVVTVLPNGMSF